MSKRITRRGSEQRHTANRIDALESQVRYLAETNDRLIACLEGMMPAREGITARLNIRGVNVPCPWAGVTVQ